MGKLIFYYSAMNGGKTAALLQVAYNYEENDKKVLIIKSSIDTKGDNYIVSRNGSKRKVDIVVDPNEEIMSYIDLIKTSDCILVDEVQFLTVSQIEELFKITKKFNIGIICYGLKTNFKGELFDGTKRLIELADNINELDMVPLCRCGEKARFNSKKVNGNYVLDGSEVDIDGASSDVKYEPLCGKCFYEKVLSERIG